MSVATYANFVCLSKLSVKRMVCADTERLTGVSERNMTSFAPVQEVGDIDCRVYSLSGSLVRLPWRQIPSATVQVSMHPTEGLPATPADPHQLLIRVMACELEFYSLDQKHDANDRPQPALVPE